MCLFPIHLDIKTFDLPVKSRLETFKACNRLLGEVGLLIHTFPDENTGEKTYSLISDLPEVGKKLWAGNPEDSLIVG